MTKKSTILCLLMLIVFFSAHPAHAFYDYKTGRWLNQDPIGSQDGPNLYAYVHSNPINRSDPQGLEVQGPGAGYDDNSWMDNPLSFPTPCELGFGTDCGGEQNPDKEEGPVTRFFRWLYGPLGKVKFTETCLCYMEMMSVLPEEQEGRSSDWIYPVFVGQYYQADGFGIYWNDGTQ